MNRKIMAAILGAFFLAGGLAGGVNADIVTGLVAYYPYDGNANDYSGKGNDPVVMNAGFTQDRFGQANQATSYDGSSNYIQYAHQTWLNINEATGFTVAFWFRGAWPQPWYHYAMIDKSHGWPSDSRGWAVQGDPSNLSFFAGGGGGGYTDFYGVPIAMPTDGLWHHLAGVLTDGPGPGQNTITAYVDGLFHNSRTHTFTVANNDRDLFIGRHYSLGRYFQGDMDEVRIYERALSPSDIQELYMVPLPASLVLLGSGLLGLMGFRRRRD